MSLSLQWALHDLSLLIINKISCWEKDLRVPNFPEPSWAPITRFITLIHPWSSGYTLVMDVLASSPETSVEVGLLNPYLHSVPQDLSIEPAWPRLPYMTMVQTDPTHSADPSALRNISARADLVVSVNVGISVNNKELFGSPGICRFGWVLDVVSIDLYLAHALRSPFHSSWYVSALMHRWKTEHADGQSNARGYLCWWSSSHKQDLYQLRARQVKIKTRRMRPRRKITSHNIIQTVLQTRTWALLLLSELRKAEGAELEAFFIYIPIGYFLWLDQDLS